MKYFELLNSGIEPSIIKEKKEIFEATNKASDTYTEKTASNLLNNFSTLLSAMASGNLYYIEQCQKNFNISEELLEICRKMTHFLLSEHYFIISNKQNSKGTVNGHINWDYEIPSLFMPILISFMKAIMKQKAKKGQEQKPVTSFFENMDKSLLKYPFENILEKYSYMCRENLIEIYKDWINIYLGRSYFIHLEELFDECAKTQQERCILHDVTNQLTAMAAPVIRFNQVPSEQTITELDQRLIKYKNALKNKLEEVNIKGHDSNLLYDHTPYILQSEKNCIREAKEQFKEILQQLSSDIEEFIIQYHKPNSLYKIAVTDLNNLTELEAEITELIEDTQTKINENIRSYYMNLVPLKTSEDLLLQSLYDTKKLLFEFKNNDYKMNELPLVFRQALDETATSIYTFFKHVRKASGDNASAASPKTTEKYFKEIWIINKIEEIKKYTIEKIEKENFPENFPSVYQNMPYVYQIGNIYFNQSPLPNDSIRSGNGESVAEQ